MLGSLIGAGASIAGGLLSNRNNRKVANENTQFQREFAQHGIRWRVEDAKAAGIHPLAALGASTHSYSPIAVGDSLGPALSSAGQDVSRAYVSSRTRSERAAELAAAARQERFMNDLRLRKEKLDVERHRADLQRMELENMMMKSQITRLASAQIGPGMPEVLTPGNVSRIGAVEVVPSQIKSADPNQSSVEAGTGPGWKRFRIGTDDLGFWVQMPNQELSEGLESLGLFSSLIPFAHNAFVRAMPYWRRSRNWWRTRARRPGYGFQSPNSPAKY